MARRRGAARAKPQDETKRVVLHGGTAIPLPYGLSDEQVAAALRAVREVLRAAGKDVRTATAWVEFGEADGATMRHAIETKAGMPGTPTAIPGLWKAVPVRSWKGGRRYNLPPQPLIQAEAL